MYKTLLVGTDGSPTADQAVQAAADLARSLGAALHIVTAFRTPRPGMGAATGVALVDSGAGQALAEESARAVGQAVILSTAVQVEADLIVVGSKGMQRRYLGSVPNSVAHGAHCAVLVVKTV
jgi:nucleotide-binding universal stress UspA family protein